MKGKLILISISFLCLFSCEKNTNSNDLPNIIYIMADDLGYGEVGVFGQKIIETPNIDKLASNGMILTNHYLSLIHI